MFNSHEGAIARPKEKLGVDERSEQRSARRGVESPEPPRLCLGEAQARHLEKLALHSSNHVFLAADGVRGHCRILRIRNFGNAPTGATDMPPILTSVSAPRAHHVLRKSA